MKSYVLSFLLALNQGVRSQILEVRKSSIHSNNIEFVFAIYVFSLLSFMEERF